MLVELRKKYYVPGLTEKVQEFVNNCQTCIKTKPVKNNSITPLLEPVYDNWDDREITSKAKTNS